MEQNRVAERPRILFVASREPSYSRVAVVHEALSAEFRVRTLVSAEATYARRIPRLLWRFVKEKGGDFDALFVGFFAQPVFPVLRMLWGNRPIIADAYFSLYDTLVHDKALYSPSSPAARLAHALDSYMLRKAALVFTDTEQHVAYFRREFNVQDTPIRRLWIGAQENIFSSDGTNTTPYDGVEPFRVLFFGGFIPLQGVETIVQAAARLPSNHFRFTIVGDGQTFSRAVALSRELGAKNIEFTGWKPINEVSQQVRQSHVVLGIFGSTEKAGRVIPNKVFEALAAGKPLITADTPAIRELLADGRDALLCRPADPDELAEKIRWARDHYGDMVRVGLAGQRTFRQEASVSCLRAILAREICDVLGPRSAA